MSESVTTETKTIPVGETVAVKTIAENDSIEENTVKENEVFIEDISEMTKEDTKQEVKPIKFLENPLPVPKKHVRKEMNYAFEPTKDQMHYDLNNYRIDDDYDLKDI